MRWVFAALAALALVYASYWHLRIWRLKGDPEAVESYAPGRTKASRGVFYHDCAGTYYSFAVIAAEGHNPYDMGMDYLKESVAPKPLMRDGRPNNPPPFMAMMRIFGTDRSSEHFALFRQQWFVLQLLIAVGAVGWVAYALRDRVPALPYLSCLLPASAPWLLNLHFGQAQILLAALTLLTGYCLAYGRDRAGGVVLGLITLSHLQPAILVIPLLLMRRWRALACWAAVVLLGVVVSLAVFPWEVNETYFSEIFRMVRVGAGKEPSTDPGWIVAQASIWGLVAKLQYLGIPTSAGIAQGARWLAFAAVLASAVLVGLRAPKSPARLFVSLVGLVSVTILVRSVGHAYLLVSPLVFALAVLAVESVPTERPSPARILPFAVIFLWLVFVDIHWFAPEPWTNQPPAWAVFFSTLHTAFALALLGWVVAPFDLGAALRALRAWRPTGAEVR